jgi:hypothetical protein
VYALYFKERGCQQVISDSSSKRRFLHVRCLLLQSVAVICHVSTSLGFTDYNYRILQKIKFVALTDHLLTRPSAHITHLCMQIYSFHVLIRLIALVLENYTVCTFDIITFCAFE